jgi:hypothetical protein
MTNNVFILGGSYSIAIAAVIGLIRFPKLSAAYQPFILITITSFLSEVISHMLIVHQKSNAVVINVFGIFDALLWLWQFSLWDNGRKNDKRFRIAAIALGSLWIAENIALGKFFVFGSVYPLTFSFLMVVFSAIQMSRQIAVEKANLFTTPEFIICCGAVLFYTYRTLIECFYAPGITGSEIFLGSLFTILSLINFIVNLLYALVVLWIPEKQKFSLPYY